MAGKVIDSRFSKTMREILILLKKHGDLSVDKFSQFLSITSMGVRGHLLSLEKEGYIYSQTVRQSKGRPRYVYSLTEKGHSLFPNLYEYFLLEFIDIVEEIYGHESLEKICEKQVERLNNDYKHLFENRNFKEKIDNFVKLLEDLGHLIEKDEDNEKIVIRTYNCPIYSVSSQFSLVCECAVKLYKTLLGDIKLERISHRSDGAHYCAYTIAKKK